MAKRPTLAQQIERIEKLIHEAGRQAAVFIPETQEHAYYSGVSEGLNYAYKILTHEMSLRYTPWR